jgi:hypothetical protein
VRLIIVFFVSNIENIVYITYTYIHIHI